MGTDMIPRGSAALVRRNDTLAARVRAELADSITSRRVLVIEDEDLLADMMAELVTCFGYEVRTVRGATEGLEVARAWRPDVITVDYCGDDGPVAKADLCSILRDDPELVGIAVALVSGLKSDIEERMDFAAGFDDWLRKQDFKPLRFKRLLDRLLCLADVGSRPPLSNGPLHMETSPRRVEIDGQPLRLSPSEFHVLYALAAAGGKTLLPAELLPDDAQGWNVQRAVTEAFIPSLRRKLGPRAPHVQSVEHADGPRGYRFAAEPALGGDLASVPELGV